MTCEDCDEVARRVDSLESLVEAVLDDLQDIDDAVADTDATVESLAQRVSDLEARQAAEQSDKEQRTEELRAAMVRKVSEDGTRSWTAQDIREELLTMGYEGFSRPVYYDHLEALTEFDGFYETEISVVRDRGGTDRTETVRAVNADAEELRTNGVCNPVTTQDPSDNTSEQHEQASQTADD